MKSIVTKNWLLARLYETDLVIIDCRYNLTDPAAGVSAYKKKHIPGAIHLDLEKDLSGIAERHGGRHPLPSIDQLAERIGKAGIGPSTRVIAYDDSGGMFAARLWWLLRYMGHEQVYVMDEGFNAWKNEGYPVSADTHIVIPQTFTPHIQYHMLADVNDVRLSANNPEALLIDSRDPRRYAGLEEPLDAKAGHIPGAKNSFWKHVLNENGSWKSKQALEEHFSKIIDLQDQEQNKELIVYCGSGVSACPNILALYELGITDAKLYSGSWSDWISYEGNPIATGEE